jgi:hypothetical protein
MRGGREGGCGEEGDVDKDHRDVNSELLPSL